ncbi:hypothetical protein [Peribacillus frigoritolerans]|uniref:hypothetical protein n=1 Tax=Peribacillus frigoritolerans TaxID=450367 RepID=UPI0037F63564
MNINVPFDVKTFILQELDIQLRNQIVRQVQNAYTLVDLCLEQVSFLNWNLGKLHKGYLDHIAVQFTLYEAVQSGLLNNMTANIVPNANGSSYHVELGTKNTKITVNRANSKADTARNAIYRTILQRDNQYYWSFDNNNQITEEPGYLELTHNHIKRTVDFVNIGVPNGKGKWFSCIDLTKELQIVTHEKVKKNEITKEALVKFKTFAQGVHENGGKN